MASSFQERIDALTRVEDAGFDATMEFATTTLIANFLFLKKYLAEHSKTFDTLTVEELIDVMKEARDKAAPKA